MALEPSVQTLDAEDQLQDEWQQPTSAAKRCVDIVGAVMALLLFLPILIFIAIAIRTSGPVLFCQNRFGKDQEIIRVYKFRTMRVDENDHAGVRQTAQNDRRVTRVGRLLRKHSIDEMPQLLNVLIGNMSLVGPRPMPIGIREEGFSLSTIENWNLRYAMKPGITGLAQVNGSRGALLSLDDAYERLHHDLAYIANWSLLRDLKIILRTIRLCIHDRNAC